MEPRELQRLHTHYASMDDDGLLGALYYGPDAYASPEIWKIIAEEASRRGMAVPTEPQLLDHQAALVAAELADRPPVPWGWGLYIRLTRIALVLLALFCANGLAGMLDAAGRREGWQVDLSEYLALLGFVGAAAWARHRQLVALTERLRAHPRAKGAA